MAFSRRRFMQWAASVSTLATVDPRGRLMRSLVAAGAGAAVRPALLPTKKEVWDQQVWMAKLGPKYTGNKAHTTFVEFLATNLNTLGLDVARERYTLPRWEARRWAITVRPASGAGFTAPVTSYFPYSGQTPAAG